MTEHDSLGSLTRIHGKIVGRAMRVCHRSWEILANSALRAVSPMIPPKAIRTYVGPFDSAYDFMRCGSEFVSLLRRECSLRPNHAVLDVACGCGLVASRLTGFLASDGLYEGFDIHSGSIEWCDTQIASRYPRFHFRAADIYNRMYNPYGKIPASSYIFEYEQGSFDVCFAKSVFTHLLPADASNYLTQIARVMKKDAVSLTTFFILRPFSIGRIKERSSLLEFSPVDEGTYWVHDYECPEHAVAYQEEYLKKQFSSSGLRISRILYGTWPHQQSTLPQFQDMIVAYRR